MKAASLYTHTAAAASVRAKNILQTIATTPTRAPEPYSSPAAPAQQPFHRRCIGWPTPSPSVPAVGSAETLCIWQRPSTPTR